MKEKWKPEKGEKFWFINYTGDIHSTTYYGDGIDPKFIEFGNIFKTEEKAKAAVEKIKALLLSLPEPVTDCKQLPKLTAEVFDRPDCPEWAKYAAVDADGRGVYYKSKPYVCEADREWVLDVCVVGTNRNITGYFDPTDWQNSRIERPEKKQDCSDSEWRKVGEWVTYYEDQKYKYFKIAKIELNRLYSEDGKFSLMCNVGKARLRPYNAEEMKSLVGKVVVWSDKPVLVTDYKEAYYNTSFIRLGDRGWYDAKDLYENEGFVTVDGSPCGVLEHLNENGEWVE